MRPAPRNRTFKNLYNILSIDLEEWYHPEYVRTAALGNKQERITKSLEKTLGLLDEHNVNATFFVVGELLEKHPEIVEKIKEKGHEIAFHGYHHEPLWKSNAETLRSETKSFRSLIKEKCLGFRAPSFSLSNETKWALKVLEEVGYIYDSSVFPAKTPLYGLSSAPIRPYMISCENVAKEDENAVLWEFPLLVYSLAGVRVPVAGGFYLRFFPVDIIKRAVKKANKQRFPAVLFVHNWELDAETPKLKLGLYKSFVTYYNLEETRKKLNNLLSGLEFTSVRNFMEEKGLT